MKINDIAMIGIGAAILYLIWKSKEQIQKGTDTVTDWVANAWMSFDSFLPGQGGIELLGNVLFPDGARIPIGQIALKTDRASGKVYTMRASKLYQLQPSNTSGDWPAILVTG